MWECHVGGCMRKNDGLTLSASCKTLWTTGVLNSSTGVHRAAAGVCANTQQKSQ